MKMLIPIGFDEAGTVSRLRYVLETALDGRSYVTAPARDAWDAMLCRTQEKEKIVVFAIALPAGGISCSYASLLQWLAEKNTDLTGWTGIVIVDGPTELFTKKTGRELIFLANQAGCAFPGRPLVEATGSLYNFRIQSMVRHCSRLEAYVESVRDAEARAAAYARDAAVPKEKPGLAVIHASSRTTSNTLLLWGLIRQRIGDKADIEEISLRNGTVVDCRGCSYEACLHFGESGDCFYGGVMVEKVYPAVNRADAVVLLCPNYNDAVSANIMAFFNRLTALFRKEAASFYYKRLYALVVSGYSGGDLVAEQVLGAMNCNKNFRLPPRFALIETAHDPGSILASPGLDERVKSMAQRILGQYDI